MSPAYPLQWVGPLLAIVTVATIGAGHVLVRRLHARYGTRPAVPLFVAGALLLIASLLTAHDLLSGIYGIAGMTVVWDGIEIYRQERRGKRDP